MTALSAHFLGWANLTRVRAIELLASRGELTVRELANDLKLSQPRASWHLRTLERSRIVKTRRAGREVFCSLDVESIRSFQDRLTRLIEGAPTLNGTSAK